MCLIRLSLISIVLSQELVLAFNVNCNKDNDNKRMEQKNFIISGKGEYFFVHSVYISDLKSIDNSSALHCFHQERLKTPLSIKYTFELKNLGILIHNDDSVTNVELLFDIHEIQLGLELKNKTCFTHTRNFGFYVMTPSGINDEKFEIVVLHACKVYINSFGFLNIQKVVILISQNKFNDLDEPIDTMMKENYEMNQIEYGEFAANQSFCFCDSLVYYLNDCYSSIPYADDKLSNVWPVIIIAVMILFVTLSALILERISKISG